jgi:hypothetical protein
MSDVFLSYSRRSSKHAEALATALENLDISSWLASKNLRAGGSAEKEILKAIGAARMVAFLVDSNSPADSSDWVQREYMAALEHSWSNNEKILVPVLMGDAEPPPFLRHSAYVHVSERNPDWAQAAKKLSKVLKGKTTVRDYKASSVEQRKRLNLIERLAHALRATESKSADE